MPDDPSKTEEATEKRIQDSRKDGNVLTSPDALNVSIMMVGALVLILVGKWTSAGFNEMLQLFPKIEHTVSWELSDVSGGAFYYAIELMKILLLPMLLLMLIAIAASIAQTGFYFETKPLELKADRLKPDIKKVLPTKQNVMTLLLAATKVLIIAFISYLVMKDDLNTITGLADLTVEESISWMLTRGLSLIYKVLFFFIAVAAIDYMIKRKKYYDDLKMSKQEIKDESKDAEGDPLIKSQLRRRMRELTMNSLIQAVPDTDVVIVNPTHVAIALKYKSGMSAPKVVAKGLRKRALRIREIASKNNIPVIQEAPLARALYRKCKAGGFIPGDYFRAVAVILARLQRQGLRKF